MTQRFLYVYFMTDQSDRIGAVVPEHVEYWQRLELPGYLGGPFADRSGGSVSFEAASHAAADRIVAGDPFVAHDLISASWLKEWRVE